MVNRTQPIALDTLNGVVAGASKFGKEDCRAM